MNTSKNAKRLLGILLASSLCLTGCGNSREKMENQDAYRQIGINCMSEGDYEGAIDAFQSALDQSLAKITDREIDICYYKAQAQYQAGKTKDAIATYSALLDYDKKNADAYYLRGCLYQAEGKTKEAKADFASSIENDGKNYERYVHVIEQLEKAGDTKQADTYLKQAFELSGKTAEDAMWRGRLYLLSEDYDNAKKELESAVKEKNSDAVLYLGMVYEKQGDEDKAQAQYEAYVKEHEDDADAMGKLADLALEQEDYSKAASYLELALKTKHPSKEQSLRRKLIRAYEYAGDFASAKVQMESYVADYPKDEDAAAEYQFLQTR